jgi:carboxyl-terminal processing protease
MKKIALILAVMASILSPFGVSAAVTAEPQPAGIGIQIELTQAGAFVIDKALDGSPAQKAGLQAGDVIESVQASAGAVMVSLQGKNLEQAVDLIRGPVGVEETLMIKRGSSEFTVSATREPVSS